MTTMNISLPHSLKDKEQDRLQLRELLVEGASSALDDEGHRPTRTSRATEVPASSKSSIVQRDDREKQRHRR
jgi:hypothetical protein